MAPAVAFLRSEEEPQYQPCQCGRRYQRRGGREDAELHNRSFPLFVVLNNSVYPIPLEGI